MLKHIIEQLLPDQTRPAAFRRLCVETIATSESWKDQSGQPPSGGCVLKPAPLCLIRLLVHQPPSGGCVLKRWLFKDD